MNNQKILSLLGLCYKAGRLAAGEVRCETAVRSGDAKLVLVTEDASKNTKKKFTNRCAYYQVALMALPFTKIVLGKALGKEERSCAAVCEEGFAKSIRKWLDEQAEEMEGNDIVNETEGWMNRVNKD